MNKLSFSFASNAKRYLAVAIDDKATSILMLGGAWFDAPQSLEEKKNKLLVNHPAQSLKPNKHTIQKAHDSPWIGAYIGF